jgi:hypothetical protein
MSYRELSMIEVKEILRLWLDGHSQREVSKLTMADRKTVRRYVETCRRVSRVLLSEGAGAFCDHR